MLGFTKEATIYHQAEDGAYVCRVVKGVSVSQSVGIQPSIRRVAIPGRHSTPDNAFCVRILNDNPMRYCEPGLFDGQDAAQYTVAPGDIVAVGQGPQALQSVSQLDALGLVSGTVNAVQDLRQGPLGHMAITCI